MLKELLNYLHVDLDTGIHYVELVSIVQEQSTCLTLPVKLRQHVDMNSTSSVCIRRRTHRTARSRPT